MTPTRTRLAEALDVLSSDARGFQRAVQNGKLPPELAAWEDALRDGWEKVAELCELLSEEEMT